MRIHRSSAGKGTTARQRRLVSTLARLWEDAKAFQVQTPAIILVGKVCTLSEKFDWVKNLPLWGKQILTTRRGRTVPGWPEGFGNWGTGN